MSTNDFTTADNIVKSLLNQSAVIIADEQLLPREAEFFNAFRAQLANGEAFIPAGSENPSEKPRYYFHDKFKKKFSNLCQMLTRLKGHTARGNNSLRHAKYQLNLHDGRIVTFHALFIDNCVGGLNNGIYLYDLKVAKGAPFKTEAVPPPHILLKAQGLLTVDDFDLNCELIHDPTDGNSLLDMLREFDEVFSSDDPIQRRSGNGSRIAGQPMCVITVPHNNNARHDGSFAAGNNSYSANGSSCGDDINASSSNHGQENIFCDYNLEDTASVQFGWSDVSRGSSDAVPTHRCSGNAVLALGAIGDNFVHVPVGNNGGSADVDDRGRGILASRLWQWVNVKTRRLHAVAKESAAASKNAMSVGKDSDSAVAPAGPQKYQAVVKSSAEQALQSLPRYRFDTPDNIVSRLLNQQAINTENESFSNVERNFLQAFQEQLELKKPFITEQKRSGRYIWRALFASKFPGLLNRLENKRGSCVRGPSRYESARFELSLSDGRVLSFQTIYIHDQIGGLANGVYLYCVSLKLPSIFQEVECTRAVRLLLQLRSTPLEDPPSLTVTTAADSAPSRPRSPTPEEWRAQAESEPMELEQPEAFSPTEFEQRPLALSDLQMCVLDLFEHG